MYENECKRSLSNVANLSLHVEGLMEQIISQSNSVSEINELKKSVGGALCHYCIIQ